MTRQRISRIEMFKTEILTEILRGRKKRIREAPTNISVLTVPHFDIALSLDDDTQKHCPALNYLPEYRSIKQEQLYRPQVSDARRCVRACVLACVLACVRACVH